MPESGSSSSRKSYISYEDTIRRTSENYGVPADLVRAIIKVESDFDPYAKSEDGAIGIMQLMPETARLMGVRNLYDPSDNIEGGVRYLSHLLQRFESDIPLAVAAYNAGETAVVKYRSIPPFNETRLYVKKVLSYQKRYRDAGR
ncbi:MAG: transglycosylase SLT domain-containing protein [Deltaproteobacteria bacterium]|nr:transglycosylase SLT domain-containing protein [Deltaproteobacteria bacterium]